MHIQNFTEVAKASPDMQFCTKLSIVSNCGDVYLVLRFIRICNHQIVTNLEGVNSCVAIDQPIVSIYAFQTYSHVLAPESYNPCAVIASNIISLMGQNVIMMGAWRKTSTPNYYLACGRPSTSSSHGYIIKPIIAVSGISYL